VALLFFFRFVVPYVHYATAGHARGKQNQSSVGVNGESLREFLEVLTLRIFPAHADANLHEHALTAASCSCVNRGMRDFGHATSLQINYTRQKRIVERFSGGSIQTEN